MREEYFEDDEDDENDEYEPLILSISKDGKTDIHKTSDYVEILEKDMNLIKGFLNENNKEFQEYCKKLKVKKE